MLTLIKIFSFTILIFGVNHDLFKFLPTIFSIILAIAFFTLFERKVLAAMQRRRGPNVTGIYGSLQALADGFKSIVKETIIPNSSNYLIFIMSPIITFTLSLVGWSLIPSSENVVIADIPLGILALLAISSLGVYGIIMAGWSSNSKYAFLGALRSSAQMISYEVSMGLLIMPVLLLSGTANLTAIVLAQEHIYFFIPLFPSFILFLISILAETNRLPFDPPEAESESVSGYNTEYSPLTLALFPLAEYSNMILMCSLTTCLFLGGWLPPYDIIYLNRIPGWVWFSSKVVVLMFSFVWVRATLPRYRFDQLMQLGWKVILPLSSGSLVLSINLYMSMIIQ